MTHVERDTVTRALATAADWELEGVCGESFLSLNAKLMRAYMQKYGVARRATSRRSRSRRISNALTNPNALLHKAARPRNVHRVAHRHGPDPVVRRLARFATARRRSSSPHRTWPRRLQPGDRACESPGSALATAPLALARRPDPLHLHSGESSTQPAIEASGRRRIDDIDLFELHDAYTIMTALTLEAAGFARARRRPRARRRARIGLQRRAAARNLRRPQGARPSGRRERLLPDRRSVSCSSRSRAGANQVRRRGRRVGAEHRRHRRHRREPRADARTTSRAQLPNLRLARPSARSRRRSAAAPHCRRRANGSCGAGRRSRRRPGCCNVRNSARRPP